MLDSLPLSIVVNAVIFSVVAIVAVALRFHCRRLRRIEYGLDDWFILPALIFAIGLAITCIISVFGGRLGQHELLGPKGEPVGGVVLQQTAFVNQILNPPCFAFTKLSVLFFYRRIFRGSLFNFITWTLIVLSAIWGISFFVAAFIQCTSFELNWTTNPTARGHNCINPFPKYLANAASDFIIDLAILCIPWPIIWQLQMPSKQRFAVMGIFMLGGLICGISIARFVFFVQSIDNMKAIVTDITWASAAPAYWSQLEAALAVTCACLPTLRPLFRGFSLKSILGSRGGRIFSTPTSKAALRNNVNAERNTSFVALHSLDSLPQDIENVVAPISRGGIRFKQDFEWSAARVVN